MKTSERDGNDEKNLINPRGTQRKSVNLTALALRRDSAWEVCGTRLPFVISRISSVRVGNINSRHIYLYLAAVSGCINSDRRCELTDRNMERFWFGVFRRREV